MITLTWGREDKSVLLYNFEARWTIDDLIEALDAGVKVVGKYTHRIDVMVDLTHSGWPDLLGVDVTSAFSRAMRRGEAYIDETNKEPGAVVVISQNPIIRGTLSTLMGLYQRMGNKILLAEGCADADVQLDQLRAREAAVAQK
ncbi:MAG: hypothetical protein ACOYL5_16375 [Phototrophicaceae bacterium]|jgi:hypothetical protein